MAAVCHAPAVLLKAKDPSGSFLLDGKKVTGFSNSEEAAASSELLSLSIFFRQVKS